MDEYENISKLFSNSYKKVSIIAWILKLIAIPIEIILAQIIADVVKFACNGDMNAVISKSIFYLAIVICYRLGNVIAKILYDRKVSKVRHSCKMKLYNIFLSEPLHILYKLESGEAIQKINDDFDTMSEKYLSLYPDFYTSIIKSAVYFIYFIFKGPIVAFCLLVISLIQIISPIIVKKFMQANYQRTREIEAETTNFMISSFFGFSTIKLYNLKEWYLNKLRELHKRYLKIGNTAEITFASQSAMDALIENILTYAAYGIVGIMIMLKKLNMSVGVEAIALSSSFFSAVKMIFDSIPKFGVSKVAEARLEKLIVKQNVLHEGKKENNIVLKNITLSYGEKNILSNASVNFPLENITVIAGINGIGKSSILKMIIGLIKYEEGEITVFGFNPLELSEKDFMDHVFYLDQTDPFYNMTPERLFTMVCAGKKDDCMENAKQYGLVKKIMSSSLISELSGGERKKVFLSIAFALDKPLLLLDEPTNSLDRNGKLTFSKMLKGRKKPTIIVTHDESLFSMADEIYVVKEGGVRLEQAKKIRVC